MRTATTIKVTFDTSTYEAAHGKKPRGNGLWTFQVTDTEHRIYSSYANAKERMRAIVAEHYPDASNIWVRVLA